MEGWIALAIAIALIGLAAIANHRGWIDLSNKNRSSGNHGAAFGAIDEVFFPTRHEAQQEIDRQTVLPAPAPVAGDDHKGVYDGVVRIDLEDDANGDQRESRS